MGFKSLTDVSKIVDSPTYSVVEVAGKKFPASFLVDRLPGLEKVWEVESEWFRYEIIDYTDIRVEKELDYPIQLENMRYFGRLMKKKKGKLVFSEATGST
jgi:25S rRNA (uracil2843-N3)-methyltransferase